MDNFEIIDKESMLDDENTEGTKIVDDLNVDLHLKFPKLQSITIIISKKIQWIKSLTVRNGTLILTPDYLMYLFLKFY